MRLDIYEKEVQMGIFKYHLNHFSKSSLHSDGYGHILYLTQRLGSFKVYIQSSPITYVTLKSKSHRAELPEGVIGSVMVVVGSGPNF